MYELPPEVVAQIEESARLAPPLTDEAVRAIRALARRPAASSPAAEPQAA